MRRVNISCKVIRIRFFFHLEKIRIVVEMATDWELMQSWQRFTGSLVEEIQWSWRERERGEGREREILINAKLISFCGVILKLE